MLKIPGQNGKNCDRGRPHRNLVVFIPVTHLPRVAGSPTGANVKVTLRAFRDLFKFRLRLWRELHEERQSAAIG